MKFDPIERAADAPQQSVSAGQLDAMCRRAFGDVHIVSATELGWGTYNSTYRVDIDGQAPVILRVAPEASRRFRIEHQFMRNEYASIPYFAPIASLLPRTLAADFTHQLIKRDYLFQTQLDGVPAPDGLGHYPRPEWAEFFRQVGTIARTIHEVRGAEFGQVNGPTFPTWSDALIGYFADAAADLEDAGLDAGDVRKVAAAAQKHRDILDEITEPRLMHGDLWTANFMVEPGAPVPTITGVCDCDRVWWGDPMADWVIYRAYRRPGTERDAFWDTYGRPTVTPASELRMHFYRARHIAATRLEQFRLGHAEETYQEMRDIITSTT